MEFNGTIADECEVLAARLGSLYLGDRQVVRALTRSVPQMAGEENRLVSYLCENLDLERRRWTTSSPRTASSTRWSRISIQKDV